MEPFIILFIVFIVLFFIGIILYWIFRNPFEYPYKVIEIDITHKRNVQLIDEIDRYLCKHPITEFQNHYRYVQIWKKKSKEKVAKSLLEFRRAKQYFEVIDDKHMFVFFINKRTNTLQTKKLRETSL